VLCLALGAMRNLSTAAGAVGHQHGVGCPSNGRQQGGLCHLLRHRLVPPLVAEVAGHTAAGSLDQLGLRAGNQPEHLQNGADGGKGLLVAVAMQDQLPDLG